MPGCLADIGRHERFTTYKGWSRVRLHCLLPKPKLNLGPLAKERSDSDTSFFNGPLLGRDSCQHVLVAQKTSEGQMTGHDRINFVFVFQQSFSLTATRDVEAALRVLGRDSQQPQSGAFELGIQDDGRRDNFFPLHFRTSNEGHFDIVKNITCLGVARRRFIHATAAFFAKIIPVWWLLESWRAEPSQIPSETSHSHSQTPAWPYISRRRRAFSTQSILLVTAAEHRAFVSRLLKSN